jgi:acetolactate synthase-1/2/3 large subunit
MIKVSDYIAKRLKEVYSIGHFFMVSGGGAMHLNDSLGRELSYTCNHHEQACAIAAEGYARVQQKLAVVNITTGPGGLNCLNGVLGQWTDSVPVLYISGQVKFQTTIESCPEVPLRQLGDQEADIISVVKPLTKYAHMVVEPNEIKYHIDKAIYEALSGRQGPVWLDIPMNVQAMMIDENDLIEFQKPSPSIDSLRTICVETIQKLKNAKRPLIIAGHGIRLSRQEETFYTLLKKLNIPVVTTFNGFDLLDDNHQNYIGRIGTIGQRAGNFALQNADLVLCLGTRNNVRQASYNYENFAKNAHKIIVDIDSAELDKPTVIPDMKICADLSRYLPELVNILEENPSARFGDANWLDWGIERKEKYSFKNSFELNENEPIDAYYFATKMSQALPKNTTVVMSNGSACVCPFQTAEIKHGQRFILNSGDASMGYGLPAAIGACKAAEGRNTICIEGDGSIMMNLQELQTVVHNQLPLKIFILNNNGYISIKQTQKNFFAGRMTGSGDDSGVSVPDFVKIGDAFGLKTVRIEKVSEISEKIKEILTYDEPVLCEVMINLDYAFAPKLSARKLEDGTMVSPSLEDMFPFLNRDELEENMIK